MSEQLQQIIFSLQIIWIAVFAYFYGRGGINNNWIRRFLGTSWMMLGIFIFSMWQETWNWWYLTFLPCAIGATIIGYGKGDFTVRLRRRVFQGLAMATAPIALVIINHAWFPWCFHSGLCLSSCIFIGGFNIFPNARKNETLIATFGFLLVLFMVSKP